MKICDNRTIKNRLANFQKIAGQNGVILVILEVPKMHFGCPNQNSETTFIDQTNPQSPQKDT